MTALLWWLHDDGHHDLSSFATSLPAEEQPALATIRSNERRRGFILSRFLLRQLVADTTGHAFADVRFARTDSGRLWLAAPEGWHISLSHARDHVAVMLARHPCGVDIERPHTVRFQALADRYFSDAERHYLATLPDSDKAHPFFRLWTLKEAGVKALGVGLAHHLAALSFDVSGERPLQLEGEPLQLWQVASADLFLAAALHDCTPPEWKVIRQDLGTLLHTRDGQ